MLLVLCLCSVSQLFWPGGVTQLFILWWYCKINMLECRSRPPPSPHSSSWAGWLGGQPTPKVILLVLTSFYNWVLFIIRDIFIWFCSGNDGRVTPDEEEYEEDEEEEEGENEVRITIYLSKYPHLQHFMWILWETWLNDNLSITSIHLHISITSNSVPGRRNCGAVRGQSSQQESRSGRDFFTPINMELFNDYDTSTRLRWASNNFSDFQ